MTIIQFSTFNPTEQRTRSTGMLSINAIGGQRGEVLRSFVRVVSHYETEKEAWHYDIPETEHGETSG